MSISSILFFSGALLLAIKPFAWLVQSWLDPVYGSHGLPVFLLVIALVLWSFSSPRISNSSAQRQRLALLLLAVTALLRLSGQVLAVNTIAALALVVDVYALALLIGLDQRKRALSPAWLALVFAFALPLERIVQRTIGFSLQQLSADGACTVLSLAFESVRCEGVRLLLNGHDVLVDLPCSGARGLLLLMLLFALLATLLRPSWRQALAGFVIALAAAIVVNILRICLLAVGIAFPDWLGISVMDSPWHDLIGLITLATGALAIIGWALRLPLSPVKYVTLPENSVNHSLARQSPLLAVLFLFVAAIIITLPARPVDVARQIDNLDLPMTLAGVVGDSSTLSAQEQAYFTRYGGGAARRFYNSLGLLVVQTSAPLRHLHAPDECLTGLGHRVEYRGPEYDVLPTAVYRSTDPQGQVWRIAVTYVSDDGQLATSVAEAVWHWLQNPQQSWRMVQRITPWSLADSERKHWDEAITSALELPRIPRPAIILRPTAVAGFSLPADQP